MNFNCPIDGDDPYTVSFAATSTGTCLPTTWSWQRRINGTLPWIVFSTVQNPTNIVFNTGIWDIRVIGTCANGTTDTHTEVACFEVLAAGVVLPPCAGTQTCIKQSDGGTAIRLAATGFDAFQVNNGGQTFVNTDGISVTIEYTGSGTLGYNPATTSYGVFVGDNATGTISVTVSGGCISGSLGSSDSTVVLASADATTYHVTERPTSPQALGIAGNDTTAVTTTHLPAVGGGSLGVYSSNGTSSGMSFAVTNTTGVTSDLTISIYTNVGCTYTYWALCSTDGVYTNIHNQVQTTTLEGGYFQEIPCAEVPLTP